MAENRDGKKARVNSPATALAGDIVVLIAKELDIPSLAAVRQTSKHWKSVVDEADAQVWASHARRLLEPSLGPSAAGVLDSIIAQKRRRCYNKKQWDDVKSWQDLCRQLKYLDDFFSGQSTQVQSQIVCAYEKQAGAQWPAAPVLVPRDGDSPEEIPCSDKVREVEIGHLDLDEDAEFIIQSTAWSGLQVIDARAGALGRLLYTFAPGQFVKALEYQDGIACLYGESLSILKRHKLVYGTETEAQRGTFVHVATCPPEYGWPDIGVNSSRHLAATGEDDIGIWAVDEKELRLLQRIPLIRDEDEVNVEDEEETMEHTDDVVVIAHWMGGFEFYEKRSGANLGTLTFSHLEYALRSNIRAGIWFHFSASDQIRQPDFEEAQCSWTEGGILDHDHVTIQNGYIGEHPHHLEGRWHAVRLTTLADSSTRLVALTVSGRLFVCSDVLSLLFELRIGTHASIYDKARLCTSIIDFEPVHDVDFLSLAVHNDRAAYQVDDYIYIVPLPRAKDEKIHARSRCLRIPAGYSGGLPSPRSLNEVTSISMHDDAIVSSVIHPVFALLHRNGKDIWQAEFATSIRVLHFVARKGASHTRRAGAALADRRRSAPDQVDIAIHDQGQYYLRSFKRKVWEHYTRDQYPSYYARKAIEALQSAKGELVAFLHVRTLRSSADKEQAVLERIRNTIRYCRYNNTLDILGYPALPHLPWNQPLRLEDFAALAEMDFDIDIDYDDDAFW